MRLLATLILVLLVTAPGCSQREAEHAPAAPDNAHTDAEPDFDPLDSMSPGTTKAQALTLPLATVTLASVDLERTRRFYVDGLGMTLTGPVAVSPQIKATQRALWDIPESVDWKEYHLTRPGAEINDRPAMNIRLLILNQETPLIHASWDSRSYGGFSMGFPNRRQLALDKEIRALGFGARAAAAEVYEVPRTDGTMYTIHESIFDAPDYVHAVGIDRVGMLPLGAVNQQTAMGGPGYSAQVVKDSDAVLAFYTDVLGLELRRDSIFKAAGADGAMALPAGTEFRFSIVVAQGYGPGGHLLFVDYVNIEGIDNGIAPRVPNRGIGMWSFPVVNLDEVMSRAQAAQIDIVHQPTVTDDPLHGRVRVATMLAPNEFLIEVFQAVTQ